MGKGIDVSEHKGVIDWDKAKATGLIDFAILRLGYGNDESTPGSADITTIFNQDDEQFDRNVAECNRLGIPWGAYLYSYATNLDEAESEARHILRMLKGNIPLYPVFIDMEDADSYKAKRGVSNAMCADICELVCRRLTEAGYLAGVYANKDWLENRINDGRLKQYPIWLAQWNTEPTYDGKFGIWQYTSSGNVDGINSRVDMNISYEDYSAIIRERELNGYKKPAPPAPALKSIDEIVNEVISGKWGNGDDRKQKLIAAGYDYTAVQNAVNAKYGQPAQPAPAPVKQISVNGRVTLLLSAQKYITGEDIPASKKGKQYTVMQIGNGKVLLKELYSWVKNSDVVPV